MTNRSVKYKFIFSLAIFFVAFIISRANSQEIRWLRVTNLQSPFNEIGAEYESEFSEWNTNYFSWPALYGIEQNTCRAKGLWIGATQFYDPVQQTTKSVKVIGSGPRDFADRENQIFPQEIKLIGPSQDNYHPNVYVVNEGITNPASLNRYYDVIDDYDENLPSDRMILIKFNTSIGISVTKKIYAFAQQNHEDYFIHDYVFKNTGIYDSDGNVYQQTLNDVWFYYVYRYAFAGATSGGYGSTWGAFSSVWGRSTLNHAFGDDPTAQQFTDPSSPYYQLRGFYSYYGPHSDRPVSFEEDWGCPNEAEDGVLGAAKFAGCVTLYADNNNLNLQMDDSYQPKTTWFIASDIDAMQANVSQYDEVFMSDRYTIMSEGHPEVQHDDIVGNDYSTNYNDPRRDAGGGTSQGQGYGPYTLDYGDSVRIVFAEAVTGLSWKKAKEVGANWLAWYNNVPNKPDLYLPDGNQTTNHNEYKKAWVFTGIDSILQTFRNAYNNFDIQSNFNVSKAPPPPSNFSVTSGGDRILVEWSDNSTQWPYFDGYVIYRSRGNVLDYRTTYEKIFECDNANVIHSYSDTSAIRGFDYYYYIQSKDDGSQNQVELGKPLYSSPLWTLTTIPANLQRPPVYSTLDSVRVVPNPYDIRARLYQFGTESQYDQIAFYGLPPICKLKIFTERGDLVWEKEHISYSGDEKWNSITKYGQIVTSGIYILYVEAPDGRSVMRKFVVIR